LLGVLRDLAPGVGDEVADRPIAVFVGRRHSVQ
jgi:hypothetical protein